MRMATWVSTLTGGRWRRNGKRGSVRYEEDLRTRRLEDRCMLDAAYTMTAADALLLGDFAATSTTYISLSLRVVARNTGPVVRRR